MPPSLRLILETLVEVASIAFGFDYTLAAPRQALIKQAGALEMYYQTLGLCYKRFPAKCDNEVVSYILAPLETISHSLYNLTIVARVWLLDQHIDGHPATALQSPKANRRPAAPHPTAQQAGTDQLAAREL